NTVSVRTGRSSIGTVLAPAVPLVCPHFGQSRVAGVSAIGTDGLRSVMGRVPAGVLRAGRSGAPLGVAGRAPGQPLGLALVGDARADERVAAGLGQFQGLPLVLLA